MLLELCANPAPVSRLLVALMLNISCSKRLLVNLHIAAHAVATGFAAAAATAATAAS